MIVPNRIEARATRRSRRIGFVGIIDAVFVGLFAIVVAMGSVVLLSAKSAFVFILLLGTAATYGVWLLYRMLTEPRAVTLSNLMAMTLLTGYCGGYAVYILVSLAIGGEWQPPWFMQFYGEVSATATSYALLLVSWSALLMVVLMPFQRPLFTRFECPPPRYIVAGLGFVVLAYAAGHVGYMGTHVGSTGNASPIGTLAKFAIIPLSMLSLAHAALAKTRSTRLMGWALFILAELMVVPMGRRMFLYSAILAAIIWQSLTGHRLRFNRKVLAVGFAGLIVMTAAFATFLSMRLSEQVAGIPARELSTVDRFQRGVDLMVSNPRFVFNNLLTNVGARAGSILAYLALYIDSSHDDKYLSGELLTFNTALVVPSVIWPGKRTLIEEAQGSSEGLVHPRLGIEIYDGPNTLLTEGYADFGLWGALFYPVAITLVFAAIVRGVTRLLKFQWGYIAATALGFTILMVEQTVAAFLLDLRTLVMLVTMAVVWRLLRYGVVPDPARSTGKQVMGRPMDPFTRPTTGEGAEREQRRVHGS